MAIRVDIPASTKNLTTTLTVADSLGVDISQYQLVLDALIKRASSFIVSFTGREFIQETVTEFIAPVAGDTSRPFRIMVTRTPVVQILSASFQGVALTPDQMSDISIEDADSGFIWNDRGWTPTGVYGSYIDSYRTRFAKSDWAVQYVGGYIPPGQLGRNLPHDIEHACIELVKSWFRNSSRDQSVRSESIGDASRTYTSGSEIETSTLKLLSPWVRIV